MPNLTVIIKRPMCWFYIGQRTCTDELMKWYTNKAISLLEQDGFIDIGGIQITIP